MEETLPNTRSEICEFLKNAKTAEDFFIIQIISSNLFYSKSKRDIKDILAERDNFYISAIENVFQNPNFLEALGKVLEQYKSFQKNFNTPGGNFFKAFDKVEIKNKKLIFAALVTSLILLADVFENLTEENLMFVSERIRLCLRKLKNSFNPQYSLTEIYFVLAGVSKKEFYSKLTMKLKIEDPTHCFSKQKLASYLVSLIIKLSFRNNRLNTIFKVIEKTKSGGTFRPYEIYRLSNFTNIETKNEEKSTKELESSLSNFRYLTSFINSFKNDKNEENAFNLIKITLSAFTSKQNFEADLTNTIRNANDITKELKKYSKENFKAFSGDVTEENYEWSNKIFINCAKLLGVIESLSEAVDKKWQKLALIKEFAEWTSSVHKILNKYDIEDDWDKISKYLGQETNKVEWKSNFFTPTQITKDDPHYKEISKKCFFKIVKTILGMANSDGGVIIVGIVEKPEEIIEKDTRDSLIKKNGKFLFDVSGELVQRKLDLDGIKRKIQESLKKETLTSVDKFNNLWSIEQVVIKSEDGTKEFSVYKIEVSKSEKPIFSVKSEKESQDGEIINIYREENIWVSLLKRADSRTIYVDPRQGLTL